MLGQAVQLERSRRYQRWRGKGSEGAREREEEERRGRWGTADTDMCWRHPNCMAEVFSLIERYPRAPEICGWLISCEQWRLIIFISGRFMAQTLPRSVWGKYMAPTPSELRARAARTKALIRSRPQLT